MKTYKDDDFNGRLNAAAKAKLAMVKSHRAKAGLDDRSPAGPRAAKPAINVVREARGMLSRALPESTRRPGK